MENNHKEAYYTLLHAVRVLREMKELQCRDGNWNYDQYMHGMANGLIFAVSLFETKRPEYLGEPGRWLKNSSDLREEVVSGS